MVSVVLLVGIFVGYNVGGATTGPAFGPAVGADAISKSWAAALMTVFFFVGAWTIGRRVVDTLGTFLSWIGIPASFVVIATMSTIGLGWGRTTRPLTVPEVVRGKLPATVSIGALAADEEGEELPPIGDEPSAAIPRASDLFDPSTTGRIVLMQNLVPAIGTVGAYLTFRFIPIIGI